MLEISDEVSKEYKPLETALAVNSASLQLFLSCQNEYPIPALLATPLIGKDAARNRDLDEMAC
ncbi:hypothetical protein HGP17_07270 [Rhizobium sp. P38BS-XIX]|uniref:hypothetical protein n=1 Tax=Rhizobium sp. P38BS-XIX TaxID=2726740 RepID=UPI0014569B01|nr:hypothetical protein [Rhizobium sp. P38BS-XIX]NLR96631.1 hypothetical protein [Rhizobium sp. P38BS-XIX]